MNKYLKYSLSLATVCLIGCASVNPSFAGNEDRAGSAGATELLINPWARSSGWGAANCAGIHGLEAQFVNVAGIAFTKKTELLFSHTIWLKGADVNINSFGLTQRAGESGVIGLGITAFDFGDINVTTVDNPEGGIGTFSPSYINIGLSYAKEFSNRIYGGMTVRLISESVADAKATGVAFDAGIQYVTGFNADKDNLKFGISLKNVSAPMQFSGDGLSFKGLSANNTPLAVEYKTANFELPSLINIGIMYDIKLAPDHRLSTAFNFTANSFTKNQFTLGLEYGFKTFFMLRGGYAFEKDIFDSELRTNVLTGPSGGATFELPLGKGSATIGIDYSYRATALFSGTHSFGARINL